MKSPTYVINLLPLKHFFNRHRILYKLYLKITDLLYEEISLPFYTPKIR